MLAIVGLVALTGGGAGSFVRRYSDFSGTSWSSLIALGALADEDRAAAGWFYVRDAVLHLPRSASVAAFNGGVSFAEVGAVYLGSSVIAAAAPTPGGLGAMEAALVAGLTGVGMESGIAVAAVLSYRLLTYWLPVLPGWLSFHVLERRELI